MQLIDDIYTWPMRLRRLDLNLLLALEALLNLRSVTAAAGKLHVTQPSMSASLARLREHFSDPLLVKVGRTMQLTTLGESLLEPLRETMRRIDQTITMRPGFDPASARRTISMCASDGTTVALLAQTIARLEAEAPGISFNILPAEHANAAAMLGRQELDFVFSGYTFVLPDQPHVPVIDDDYACIVWTGNRRIRKKLTLEQYLGAGHVVARFGFERHPGFEEQQLQQLGIERRIDVSCPSVALLGSLVAGTHRIATLPARQARLQAQSLPLKVLPPPLALRSQRIDMYWHRAREQDAASDWFRRELLATSRALGLLPAG